MDPDPRAADLIDHLADVSARIDRLQADLTELYAQRQAMFTEAKTLDPPLSNRRLAEVAGVTEQAVIKARRKGAA